MRSRHKKTYGLVSANGSFFCRLVVVKSWNNLHCILNMVITIFIVIRELLTKYLKRIRFLIHSSFQAFCGFGHFDWIMIMVLSIVLIKLVIFVSGFIHGWLQGFFKFSEIW